MVCSSSAEDEPPPVKGDGRIIIDFSECWVRAQIQLGYNLLIRSCP